jgi:hypothetical protein
VWRLHNRASPESSRLACFPQPEKQSFESFVGFVPKQFNDYTIND